MSIPSVTLRRKHVTLPLFGLGTWKSSPEEVEPAVNAALECGYTLIDTATYYENEDAIGKALAGRPRESFQLVTKLFPSEECHNNVEGSLRTSLKKLGLDYVDLYLIHSPNGKKCVETWKEMLRVRDLGLTKAVGVSNFSWRHIAELEKLGLELPEVNQIELHVLNHHKEDVEWLRSKDITVMGYCPLIRGNKWGCLGGTVEQESAWMMRWSIDRGFITIPKTSNVARVKSNWFAVQEPLSKEKLAEIDAKDKGHRCSGSVANMDKPWDEVK